MKELVRYHNDLNTITFYRFGAVDFDLFMTMCNRVSDKGSGEVTMSFDELRELSGFNKHLSESEFVKSMETMGAKQLLSQGRIEEDNTISIFQLFPKMTINRGSRTVTVKVNEEYAYILNDLKKNFTRFELQEFITLNSKHSKTLYRLLKQFRTTGVLRIGLEEFKRLFDVSKGYSNRLILDKIINPSVEALEKYFANLECKVVYEPKRGRPVKGYEFTFTPEQVPQIATASDAFGTTTARKPANAFHNFEQRQYDYDELERRLLDGQREH